VYRRVGLAVANSDSAAVCARTTRMARRDKRRLV
jgi:hypothetical protein